MAAVNFGAIKETKRDFIGRLACLEMLFPKEEKVSGHALYADIQE